MTCQHCQTWNSDYEHRCTRCARRFYEVAQLEDPYSLPARYHRSSVAVLMGAERTGVTELVAEPERLLRHMAPESVAYDVAPERPQLGAPPSATHQLVYLPRVNEDLSLDLTQTRRPLRTTVEAVIYADATVSHPIHRLLAVALDASLVTIAAGLFLLTLHFSGFPLTREPLTLSTVGIALSIIVVLYKAIWAAAGADTPGMQWTHMQLLDFDGNKPTRLQRFCRLGGSGLSTLSCGLGLLWTLVDENGLSWHDHLSRTFPTLKAFRH